MKCSICGDEVKDIKARDKHIVIAKSFSDGGMHVHGDLDDKELVKELVENAIHETGISFAKSVLDKKEIVFHNRQRIGDMIMFTCAVRDFKKAFPDTKVNVISIAPHIWDYNPNIDRGLMPTPENTVKIGPGWLTNASNRLDWHFANAFRISIEQALNVSIPQGESRGDIWFSKEEYNAPRVIKEPYWIIVLTGEKGWGCKMYPFERWQEFVAQNKDITFVQLGSKEDNPPRLQGDNVKDFVGRTQDGQTGIRDLFKLFLNAEGSIGLVSFHMHLSGALYKPAIVLAGAREPVSFTRYPGHQYLATDGCLPCAVSACWHCDINACPNLVQGAERVPRCVDIIKPEDLTRALNMYYLGGRLTKGKISEKPKQFKNIVNAPPQVIESEPNLYGLTWGGGCITKNDWDFMKFVIERHKIKTVLEFGSGLSTLLMNDLGLKVTTFETEQGWIDKLLTLKPGMDIRLWDGKIKPDNLSSFDLAFVDGPAGGANRELSTSIGADLAKVVIVHDANREHEREWQKRHIEGKFEGPAKGGNRCHLWVRKSNFAAATQEKPVISTPAGKFIKIVSTARGWGGCARSVTTIMKFLVKAGHKVEFIPFRNKVGSKEYQQFLAANPQIKVTENYDTIRESCDIFFMYADDYIWEFENPDIQSIFGQINAKKKIMMLNYRRGAVGKLEWTKGWDKYMFLNSTQEAELLKLLPGVKTKVLPPCTELEPFFKAQPNYNQSVRIVRHNSQGDTKFSKDFINELNKVLERQDTEVTMIPGPSFIPATDRFKKLPRTANVEELASFLGTGNLFWYSLPEGYMDMGPRVILEAMAAGLPILADNWGGAPDRVTSDCGWICDTKEQMAEIIKNVTFEELQTKGQAARERARKEFVPERWIEEILNV